MSPCSQVSCLSRYFFISKEFYLIALLHILLEYPCPLSPVLPGKGASPSKPFLLSLCSNQASSTQARERPTTCTQIQLGDMEGGGKKYQRASRHKNSVTLKHCPFGKENSYLAHRSAGLFLYFTQIMFPVPCRLLVNNFAFTGASSEHPHQSWYVILPVSNMCVCVCMCESKRESLCLWGPSGLLYAW